MGTADSPRAYFLPAEIITHILRSQTGDDGILHLWNTCRYVSRTWKAIVEHFFEEELLPDTEIFLVPSYDLKRKLHQPGVCLRRWREDRNGCDETTGICFSFSHGFADEKKELALFNPPSCHKPFTPESCATLASAASAAKSLSYCQVVVIRIRRFANDTGVPDCHIAWESTPLLRCNWKKMFSRLLSEEALVAEAISDDSLPNWENAYNPASAHAYTCKSSKTLLEAASEALDSISYARYQNYTDVRFARLERTGALRANRKSRGVDYVKKHGYGASEAALIDCRYDALWHPYADDATHMATAGTKVQNLYPARFTHSTRGCGPGWKVFELERVKALWINAALGEPGVFRTRHIETLKAQKRSNVCDARAVKAGAEADLARLKAGRKAINEELTVLGCAGYESVGSDLDSEDDKDGEGLQIRFC